MKFRFRYAFAAFGCVVLAVAAISSSMNSSVHGNLLVEPNVQKGSIDVARVSRGWYGYNPLTALKQAFQQTSTFTQYGTAEFSSITVFFELPLHGVADLRKPRTQYVVMDTVARVDGAGQFDITH